MGQYHVIAEDYAKADDPTEPLDDTFYTTYLNGVYQDITKEIIRALKEAGESIRDGL